LQSIKFGQWNLVPHRDFVFVACGNVIKLQPKMLFPFLFPFWAYDFVPLTRVYMFKLCVCLELIIDCFEWVKFYNNVQLITLFRSRSWLTWFPCIQNLYLESVCNLLLCKEKQQLYPCLVFSFYNFILH
jgi:hypothetical protein